MRAGIIGLGLVQQQDLEFADLPPSLNNCFVNAPGKGRVKSRAYKRWLESAGWELVAQKPNRIAGPVGVSIQMIRPNSKSDIDNRVKPILDLLVMHRVIEDDNRVEALAVHWIKRGEYDRSVVVSIAAAEIERARAVRPGKK